MQSKGEGERRRRRGTSLGDADGGGQGADGVVEHRAEVVLRREAVDAEVLAGVVQQPAELPHGVLEAGRGRKPFGGDGRLGPGPQGNFLRMRYAGVWVVK